MAVPDGRSQRAGSGMLEISSIRALLFEKDSSFWMTAAPDGRARRAGSGMPKISSIRAQLFQKYSSFWMRSH